MFSASINYSDLKSSLSGKVPVIILKKPDFVIISRIDPEKIDVIIKQ